MTRAVHDTNTWVSGLGWGGPPGDVVEAALAGRFQIVTSPALLEELRQVLAYPKLAKMFGDTDEVVELITVASQVVRPTVTGSTWFETLTTTASWKPPSPAAST